ncbi:hypothetical protein TNCV_1109441 [Trichonephila clavipes]|nr:hypothetical protein TNCV_1109441 [Trichonephila clavipes]
MLLNKCIGWNGRRDTVLNFEVSSDNWSNEWLSKHQTKVGQRGGSYSFAIGRPRFLSVMTASHEHLIDRERYENFIQLSHGPQWSTDHGHGSIQVEPWFGVQILLKTLRAE